MHSKTIATAAIWLVSISVAYLVGANLSSTGKDTPETNDAKAAARPSYRAQASASSSGSRARNPASHTRSAASSPGDARAGITAVMRETDPITRVNQLLALIGQLGVDDFPQAVAEFRAAGLTRERMSEYSMLLHAWAKADPLGALDYAEKNTQSRFARQTILAGWAADNPDAALQWAESHHHGNGANPWFIGVIRGVVSTNPARASEIMAMLPYSRERGEALQTIAPHIARQGQQKALAWLNSIADERLRAGATSFLADRLARDAPESTAAWAATIDNPETRARAIGEVADAWADTDVASAVAWTETLRGTDKTRAASELIGEYAQEDSAKAAQWLDSLADSDGYERVAHAFIWSTAREHPELALSKVDTLSDAKSQRRYYERILKNWYRTDAAAAQAWMNANQVSDAIRSRATRPRNSKKNR